MFKKQHGNVKHGLCKTCGNENQNDFYPNKKWICKLCWAKHMQQKREEVKLANPKNTAEKDSTPTAFTMLSDLNQTVNKLVEMNTDKDNTIKFLLEKVAEQTTLIKELSHQLATFKKEVVKANDEQQEKLDELKEVVEEQEEPTHPKCNLPEVRRFLDSLEQEDWAEIYTAKKFYEIANYFGIFLPKGYTKNVLHQRLYEELAEMVNK
jgi:hypothetical protein